MSSRRCLDRGYLGNCHQRGPQMLSVEEQLVPFGTVVASWALGWPPGVSVQKDVQCEPMSVQTEAKPSLLQTLGFCAWHSFWLYPSRFS